MRSISALAASKSLMMLACRTSRLTGRMSAPSMIPLPSSSPIISPVLSESFVTQSMTEGKDSDNRPLDLLVAVNPLGRQRPDQVVLAHPLRVDPLLPSLLAEGSPRLVCRVGLGWDPRITAATFRPEDTGWMGGQSILSY